MGLFSKLVGKAVEVGKKVLESPLAQTVVKKSQEAFTAFTKLPVVSNVLNKGTQAIAKVKSIPAVNKVLTKIAPGLKKVPILGTVITAAFEVPAVVKGFNNGDGMRQIGRSGLKVGGIMGGFAAGAAAGSVIFPGAGTIVGGLCGIAGAILGEKAASATGNAIFGKSIEEQKQNMFAQNPGMYGGDTFNRMNQGGMDPQTMAIMAGIMRQPSIFQNALVANAVFGTPINPGYNRSMIQQPLHRRSYQQYRSTPRTLMV